MSNYHRIASSLLTVYGATFSGVYLYFLITSDTDFLCLRSWISVFLFLIGIGTVIFLVVSFIKYAAFLWLPYGLRFELFLISIVLFMLSIAITKARVIV